MVMKLVVAVMISVACLAPGQFGLFSSVILRPFSVDSGLSISIIAFLLAIAALCVTAYWSHRQVKSEQDREIAKYRVEWSDGLRDDIGDYLCAISMYFDTGEYSTMSGNEKDEGYGSKRDVVRERIRRSEASVKLRLIGAAPGIERKPEELEGCHLNPNTIVGPQSDCDAYVGRCELMYAGGGRCLEAAEAEKWLPCCMHRLTQFAELKEGSEGGRASSNSAEEDEIKKLREERFRVCYTEITNLSRIILKKEWERAKNEVRGKK